MVDMSDLESGIEDKKEKLMFKLSDLVMRLVLLLEDKGIINMDELDNFDIQASDVINERRKRGEP